MTTDKQSQTNDLSPEAQKAEAKRRARRERIINALWGVFVADALAMPAHWFYSMENIYDTFDGGLKGYTAPPHPHPESFMVGMEYQPDVARAEELGRPWDILHENARFYETSYSDLAIARDEQDPSHGNPAPAKKERYHYHHGLDAGDNTLGAHLVRVLMRCVAAKDAYESHGFIQGFIEHLTTPGANRDPYTEIYIRRWFENYAKGVAPESCAARQRDIWSIGSHGGVIRPLVLSMLAPSAYQGMGLAIEHQNITHRSENCSTALFVLVPMLQSLLTGEDPMSVIPRFSRLIRLPEISGKELFEAYRAHNGPGNIPDEDMWRMHTTFDTLPFDLETMAELADANTIVGGRLATACYPEHGVPLMLYLARRQLFDFEPSVLSNANMGGDNVHRGMLLGLLLGAAKRPPEHLIQGLKDAAELEKEITAFADVAASGKGI